MIRRFTKPHRAASILVGLVALRSQVFIEVLCIPTRSHDFAVIGLTASIPEQELQGCCQPVLSAFEREELTLGLPSGMSARTPEVAILTRSFLNVSGFISRAL